MRIGMAWGTVLLLAAAGSAHGAEPDWSEYGALLRQHLVAGEKNGVALNLVRYAALKADPRLGRVLAQVEGFDTATLATPAEKLAFHVNAYNLLALRMVTDHWPLESIKDVGVSFLSPVWKKEAGSLGGKKVSLDDVENAILRPMGDPRIHFAIVCASVSCPDLRDEPYTASRLDEQFSDQVRRFLANPAKGARQEAGVLRISKIFSWFGEDFSKQGGIEAFIGQYHPLPPGTEVAWDLPYDWSVNAAP